MLTDALTGSPPLSRPTSRVAYFEDLTRTPQIILRRVVYYCQFLQVVTIDPK